MKSVVICTSKRFKEEVHSFARALRERGVVVFEPDFRSTDEEAWAALGSVFQELIAQGLTYDHFNKIEKADVVFVFNPDGYVGNSVTLEIGYAVACRKPIYVLSTTDPEICRSVLYDDLCGNVDQLVEMLQ